MPLLIQFLLKTIIYITVNSGEKNLIIMELLLTKRITLPLENETCQHNINLLYLQIQHN